MSLKRQSAATLRMTLLVAEKKSKKPQEFELLMASRSKTGYNAGITPHKF